MKNYHNDTGKGMKTIAILMLSAILSCPVGLSAQDRPVTKINIDKGVDQYTAADLEHEVEDLLRAIQIWNRTGEDTFPNEPGSAELKQLVTEHGLQVYYESINTVAVEAFDGHTVPNIVLKANRSESAEPMAIALTFALDGTFLRVSADKREFSAQRILAAEKSVNPEEQSIAGDFLNQYRQAYEQYRTEALRQLLANGAKIVTGKEKTSTSAVDFYSYTEAEYIAYVDENIFIEGNQIRVAFDSMRVYRDPLQEQQVGIYVHQRYESTTYTDQGYLFMLVDLSGSEPQLQYRVWRAEPIRPGSYGLSVPELETIVQEYQQPPISFYSGDIVIAELPSSFGNYGPVRAVDPVAFPTISSPSFLERNRYWIIAGASAVAGGVAYGILQSGSNSPGIPVPPGRPAMD
ncbi:MAG: hypothetical protein ACQETE_16205 [Bacteroidota bacterium]